MDAGYPVVGHNRSHDPVAELVEHGGESGDSPRDVAQRTDVVISGGAAGCWTLDNRAPRMIRDNFEPGFFAAYQYKDLRIATDAGEAFGSPMPATELAHEMYKSMVETGLGHEDNSGVMQVIERLAGTEARIEE